MILSNIDSFMNTFLQILWNGVKNTWDTMESIEFGGTNYLQVMVTIAILGIALPIFLSLVKNSTKIENSRKVEKNDKSK